MNLSANECAPMGMTMNHDDELLSDLYRQMLRIRWIEEAIADEYPQQEMRCPVHLSIGQEAAAVGICSALERTDQVLSGHRAHAHYLAKGGDLRRMLAEIYGRVDGCAGGHGGSMHLIDQSAGFLGATPIVGSTIPIAVGAAFASQRMATGEVTAVFFGDGAVETGAFHESLNFAVLHDLPVLFVCENNLYSVYSPLSVRQPTSRSIAELAAGHGVQVQTGDGNDVIEVRRLADEAVDRARAGGGPTFIELATYRWREHCGPEFDNEMGYRTVSEFEHWRTRCPIERAHDLLARTREWDERRQGSMESAIAEEIHDAFEFAKQSPYPDPEIEATARGMLV